MPSKPRRESIRPPPDGTWLRTVLDAMVEAVLVIDGKGRVTLTNRALDALTTENVRGRRAKNVIKSEPLRVAMRNARKKSEATDVQLEASVGGRVHVFRAQVSPLPRGAGAVAVLHDVTALKDADQLRREFVANASHELRTPLTAIRGFAETLIDGALEDRAATVRFLDAILRQTKRLQSLAEDLAALARAESSEDVLPVEPRDLRTAASDVVAGLEPLARSRSITVRLVAPTRAVRGLVSPPALDQVLTNLVDNAIKYSPDGGRIVVTVAADAKRARIDVRDHGRGIAPEHHGRVFERFYRVDEGRSRAEGGTGLGLAIVRHLVTRMSGTVRVESAPGKGSLFRVELPRAPGRPRSTPVQGPAVAAKKR